MNIKRTVPYKNIYSNDTTNISTCISPYHKTRGAVRHGENIIRFIISSNEKEDFGFYYVDMFPDPKRR